MKKYKKQRANREKYGGLTFFLSGMFLFFALCVTGYTQVQKIPFDLSDFSGGLNTFSTPSQIAPNEAIRSENTCLTRDKTLTKRGGFTSYYKDTLLAGVDGLWKYYKGDSSYLMMGIDTALYRVTSGSAKYKLQGQLPSANKFFFTNIGGKVAITKEKSSSYVYDGSFNRMGIADTFLIDSTIEDTTNCNIKFYIANAGLVQDQYVGYTARVKYLTPDPNDYAYYFYIVSNGTNYLESKIPYFNIGSGFNRMTLEICSWFSDSLMYGSKLDTNQWTSTPSCNQVIQTGSYDNLSKTLVSSYYFPFLKVDSGYGNGSELFGWTRDSSGFATGYMISSAVSSKLEKGVLYANKWALSILNKDTIFSYRHIQSYVNSVKMDSSYVSVHRKIFYLGQYSAFFNNCLFLNVGDSLYWSTPSNQSDFPPENCDVIPDKITGMATFFNDQLGYRDNPNDVLFIFCQNSIWIYEGEYGDFRRYKITDGVGCIAPQSITNILGKMIVFADYSGVWGLTSREPMYLSNKIKSFFLDSIPRSSMPYMVGGYYDRNYYLSYPRTGSVCNRTLIFNIDNNSWSLANFGFSSAFSPYSSGDTCNFILGSPTKGQIFYFNESPKDTGVSSTLKYQTGWFTQPGNQWKKLEDLYLEFRKGYGDLKVRLYKDYETTPTDSVTITTTGQNIEYLNFSGEFKAENSWSVEFESSSDTCEIIRFFGNVVPAGKLR